MDQGREIAPKVSVIMPVYNTGNYVEEAVNSIINQTLSDIEIIIVNDGSTDNSLQVVERIASTDNRVQVYSQKNGGQSVARNVAMGYARGEYIYFMDSDDWLEPQALQECLDKCSEDKLDFVFFDADVFSDNEGMVSIFDYHRCHMIEDRIYSGMEILDILLDNMGYRVSPCIHFINARFLKQINISFYPGIIHEDELYMALMYVQAKRVGLINQSFFKRRVRGNSTMTNKFAYRNMNGYLTVLAQLKLFAKDKDDQTQQIIEKTLRYIFDPIIYTAHSLRFGDKIKVLKISIREKYLKYASSKSILVFLFPFLIRIKSIFKKQQA